MSVRTDVINLTVNVNGNAAQAQLNTLRKRAADVKLEMEGLKKGTEAYIAKKAELAGINDEMAKLKQQIGITALSQKELVAELNKLKALKGSVAPFSQEFKELQTQIEKVESRLYDVKNGVQGFASFFSKIKDEVKQFGVMAAGYLGFQFLTSSFQNVIQGAGKMSDQLADIRRVTGLSAAEVAHLNTELGKLDTRTATSQLRDIAKVAGMLGVGKDDILGFVKATDMLSVALGDELGSVDQITSSLGKILNVFDGKITAENMTHLGNAIVDLSNKGVATGGFIVDFTQRLSGIAKTANISAAAILGFGAGIEENGGKVESGATALQKVIIKIGEDVPKAAAIAGAKTKEEVAKFVQDFSTAPEKAILAYAKGLQNNKASFAEITSAFKDAGEDGARVISTLATLGQKSDFFAQKIKDAGAAMKDSNEITDAFALKNETFGATLDKLGKELNGFSLGFSSLAKGLVNGLVDFIEILKKVPAFVKENATALSLITAGILFMNQQLIVAGILMLRDAAVKVANAVATRAVALANNIAAIATNVAAAAQAAYALVVELVTGRLTLAAAASRIWAAALSIGLGPLGIILTLVGALVIALSNMTSKVKELSAAQKLGIEVADRAAKSTAEQETQIKLLTKAATDNSKSLADRKAALQQLIALNPQYLNGLTLENLKTAEGTKILQGYVQALREKAQAQATNDIYVEKLKGRTEDFNKVRGSVKELAGASDADVSKYLDNLVHTVENKYGKKFSEYNADDEVKFKDAGVDLLKIVRDAQQINILEKQLEDLTKKSVTASTAVNAVADSSVGALRKKLQAEIDSLKASYETLDSTDEKSKAKNLANQKKLQDQLTHLDGKESKEEKKADTKAESDYQRELKEADKFYASLKKLKDAAALKDQPKDDAELQAVQQKYAELIAKAKDFLVKKIIDAKKYGEEEKLIEEAKQAEIDALIKKHIDARLKDEHAKEYDDSLLASQGYYDQVRVQAAQAYAANNLTKQQYDDKLKQLDRDELADRITIANDYSAHVKKAAEDVTRFKKEQEQKTTKDLIAETEERKKVSDEEKLSKAQRGVITAKGKGIDAEVDAKKALLQTQFDLDTQYLDKKSELYQLKETELQEALKDADSEGLQHKLENLMTYVGYFADALSSVNTIVTQNESKQLSKDKKKTETEKKTVKKQFDDKLLSQSQYDKKTAELDAQQEAREKEVKRKQAIREKALNLFNAIISNYAAVNKTMASVAYPFNIPLAVAQGIAGGLQIASIANAPLPELGKGDWVRKGDKHSDPSRGIPVKIERDEAVMSAAAMTSKDVVTVTGTTAQITSALNKRKGGVNWAGGAVVQMPKWRTEPSAQLNPGLVRYMATGGLGSGETAPATTVSMEETNGLLRQLIAENQKMKEEIRDQKTKLHAVVSIKEYRDKEAQYDAAKKVSGIAQ